MDVYSQFCELVKMFLFNAAVIIVSNYCGDCLLTPIYEKVFYKFALLFEFV